MALMPNNKVPRIGTLGGEGKLCTGPRTFKKNFIELLLGWYLIPPSGKEKNIC